MPSLKPYYERDGIVIYHGNCRDILPQLQADVILTDPPYKSEDANASEAEWSDFCGEWFRLANQVTERIVFTPGTTNLWRYPEAKWVIAWYKPSVVAYSRLRGLNVWEPILVYGKMAHPVPRDLVTYDSLNFTQEEWAKHPHPKTPYLWGYLMSVASAEGETILDPFMGTGVTLRKAKDLGRKAIGIDANERWCEIAAKRMAQGVLL